MFSDWYFSTCVGHDSDTTKAVMSILRVLGNHAPDPLPMRIALDELERADVWTKVYAVPSVLRAIKSGFLLHDDIDVAMGLLSTIVEASTAPADWRRLIALVLTGGDAGQLPHALEQCAGHVLRGDAQSSADTPYMDLPSHSSAVVWLAVLRSALTGPSSDDFARLLQRSGGDSGSIVKEALANRFGRFPLRLAIEAKAAAGQEIPPEPLARIVESAGVAHLEPDLVELIHVPSIDEIVTDDTALRSAILDPVEGSRRTALTPHAERVLRRLGIALQPGPMDPNAKAHQLALCFKHVVQVARAMELRGDFVFKVIATGMASQQRPFWIPVNDRANARTRYSSWDPDVASYMMAGLSLALADWVERSEQRALPADMWLFLTHAADVLAGCERPMGKLTLSLIDRTVAKRMPVEDVVGRIQELPATGYVDRVKARAAVRLVGWFLQAYRQGIAGRPERRWLEAAAGLADLARMTWTQAARWRVVTSDEVVRGACVDCLFAKRSIDPWMQGLLQTRGDGWPHMPRELLLPLRPAEADWYPNWPQPDSKNDNNYPLFVATERCAHHDKQSAHDPFVEWDHAFADTPSSRLDSLLRLRLVGLLGAGCFDAAREFQIVNALLASDSPYEIQAVLERVFQDPQSSLADRVHQILVARVEGERERAQQRDHPNPVWIEFDRREAMLVGVDWLGRLLGMASARHEWTARFCDRRALARAMSGPQRRLLHYTVEHLRRRPILVADLPDAAGGRVNVRGAAFDVEHQQATVLATVLAPPGTGAASNGAPAVPEMDTGFVESVRQVGERWASSIDTGRVALIDLPTTQRPEWNAGDYVQVPRDRREPVRLLHPLTRPGDIAKVDSLKFMKGEAGVAVGLVLEGIARGTPTRRGSPSGWFDQFTWSMEADATTLHSPTKWARLEYDGQWLPLMEDRLALLAAMGEGVLVKLVWTGERLRAISGELGWVVDAGGGLRYALARRDFMRASWAEVCALVESGQSQEDAEGEVLVPGMLIVLRRNAQGLFELVETSDARIRWHRLFEPEEVVTIRKDGPAYSAAVPPDKAIQGRPDRVDVQWLRAPDIASGDHVDGIVERWDGWRSLMVVDQLRLNSLANRSTWPALCRDWRDLKAGDELIATKAWGQPLNNKLRVRTPEGFVAEVHAEELWGWEPTQFNAQLGRGRLCHVDRIQSFDLDEFQDRDVAEVDARADALFLQEKVTGFICSLPMDRKQGRWEVALWPEDEEEPIVAWIRVELPHRPLGWPKVGDEVRLSQTNGVLRISVAARVVLARPVWTLDVKPDAHEGGSRRVAVWHQGRQRAMEILGPDRLGMTAVEADLTEEQEGVFRHVGRAFVPETRGRSRTLRRVVAQLAQDRFACANLSDENAQLGRYRWTVIDELQTARGANQNQFYLLRTFTRAIPRSDLTAPGDMALGQQAEQALEARLEGLIREQTPVSVQVDGRGGGVRLLGCTLPARDRKDGAGTVALMKGDGPYVTEVDRRPGLAVLLRQVAQLLASTRHVSPIGSVDAWIDELITARILADVPSSGAEFDLGSMSLFYVGPESGDPLNDTKYDDGLRYRFEWAPGRCLVVPAGSLQFNGASFESAASQLFFADNVRRVALNRDTDTGDWRVDVREIGIAMSEGHRLFRQASDWKIVHLVRVRRSMEGGIDVAGVDSLHEDDLDADTRRFKLPAVLSGDGAQARVLEALGDATKGVVHGRLDVGAYLESQGRKVSFEPVWLTIGPRGLREGERIFLVADKIVQKSNDCILTLAAPEGLIGPPAQRLGLGMRRFSARVDLLRRLALEDENVLVGRQFLVRVRQGENEMRLSVIEPEEDRRREVPRREQSALRGWLKKSSEPPLVCVVQDDPDAGVLLEVRPGVFVAVDAQRLQCDVHRPMQYGTILRLNLADKITAVEAMPSDGDLVPEGGRFVTFLPMGGAAAALQRMPRFTCESLPNVVARLDTAPGQPDADGAMRYRLQRPHPRPAWVVREALAADDLQPANEDDPLLGGEAHRFLMQVWSWSDAAVFVEPFDHSADLQEWGANSAPKRTSWLVLTFADTAGDVVREAALTRSWRVHDRRTWSFAGEGIESAEIAPAVVATSLVFAQRSTEDDRALRLRYSRHVMQRFVFPPRELSAMVPPDGSARPWTVAIAGIDLDRRWFFVEVAPGRVYVLPLALLVVNDEHGIHEVELTGLALDRFGIGDQLSICRVRGQAEEVDRVRLVNWTPGTRSALGGARMLLHLDRVDASRQVSHFGAGAFQLALPFMANTESSLRSVVIDQDNSVSMLADVRPQELQGVGALLCIGKDGEPAIDGLSGFVCRPDRDYDWAADAVGRGLLPWSGPGPGPHLRTVGGAVPITLQFVDTARKVVFFNRRLQNRTLSSGVCPASVIGALEDDSCIIRLGSELRIGPLGALVMGLPPSKQLVRAIAAELQRTSRLIWTRIADDGLLHPGLKMPREAGEDGAFTPIAMIEVADGDGHRIEGLLCECTRSWVLHWLPVKELAWTDLSRSEAAVRKLFLDPMRPLRAQLQESGQLSVVKMALARSEFAAARPGTELVVRPTGERRDDGCVFVLSSASNVVLTFSERADACTEELRAVVRRRDRQLTELHCEAVVSDKLWLDVGDDDTVAVTEEIRAILDLHRNQVNQGKARGRLEVLARRAWRHWPTELLLWTETPGPYGPWSMFSELREVLLGRASPGPHAPERLKSFCRVVELGHWRDDDESLIHLAAAARAVSGDLTSLAADAMNAARISARIRELGGLVPTTTAAPNRPLPGDVAAGLQRLLEDLERTEATSGDKLRWGAPLPPFA